jgi:carbonic anhydrase
MRNKVIIVGMLAALGAVHAAGGAHWSYSGEAGPEHWGALSPEFAACSEGKNQSPIDLSNFIESDLAPLEFHYQADGNAIVHNGHTVQVNHAPGSRILIDGHIFALKQHHFHVPSENRAEGKSYPMEAHFVHADTEGKLAVVAVLFEEGAANPALARVWAALPAKAGEKRSLSPGIAASDLLPAGRDYYRYNGSLTTPPCTEGVRWFVMKEPVFASRAQIGKLARALGHPNNRPTQPINARPLLR